LVAGNVAPTMCEPAVVLKRTRIGGRLRLKPNPAAAAVAGAAPCAACVPPVAATPGRPEQLVGVFRPPPCQFWIDRRLPSRSISIRSHATEPNPVGDMLSPKIGVTVTVYSPSEGNVCGTSMPPRVPNGSPST